MKKMVLRYGLLGGLIVGGILAISVAFGLLSNHDGGSMLLGYASMLLAFSLIFVGVKSYRDKQLDGFISFGKAFKMALLTMLVTSTIYVLVWLICYYFFIPDFMEQYASSVLKRGAESGMSAADQAKEAASMQQYIEWYKNPLFVILLTYAEIVPVGVIVSLIVALILKRKDNRQLAGAV